MLPSRSRVAVGAACLSVAESAIVQQLMIMNSIIRNKRHVFAAWPDWLEDPLREISDNFELEMKALDAEAETDLRVNIGARDA